MSLPPENPDPVTIDKAVEFATEPLPDGGIVAKAVHYAPPPTVPGYRKKARRWTPEEDARLATAVQMNGVENWPAVAAYVGGDRTRSQCSQRWHRCIDPNISKSNWSREEEQKLIDAVKTYGSKAWTRIAAEMGDRCDVQCRFRYGFLQKKAKEMNTEIQPISAPMAVTRGTAMVDPHVPFAENQPQDEQDQPPVMPEAKDAA